MVPGMGGGRGKHPRGMAAKTLPFPEKAAWLGPISSTCTWTHTLWDTNRVNERSMGSFRALISLDSQNNSGMPCKTRTFRKALQQWHARKAKRMYDLHQSAVSRSRNGTPLLCATPETAPEHCVQGNRTQSHWHGGVNPAEGHEGTSGTRAHNGKGKGEGTGSV